MRKTNRPWLEPRKVEQDDHEQNSLYFDFTSIFQGAHGRRKIEVEAIFGTWCGLSVGRPFVVGKSQLAKNRNLSRVISNLSRPKKKLPSLVYPVTFPV